MRLGPISESEGPGGFVFEKFLGHGVSLASSEMQSQVLTFDCEPRQVADAISRETGQPVPSSGTTVVRQGPNRVFAFSTEVHDPDWPAGTCTVGILEAYTPPPWYEVAWWKVERRLGLR